MRWHVACSTLWHERKTARNAQGGLSEAISGREPDCGFDAPPTGEHMTDLATPRCNCWFEVSYTGGSVPVQCDLPEGHDGPHEADDPADYEHTGCRVQDAP